MKAKALACLSLNDGNLSITICTSGLVDGSFQKKLVELGLLIRECLSLFLILIILGLVLGLLKKAWARAQAQKWRLKFIEPLICREKKTRAWRQRSRRSNRGLDFFPFPPTSFIEAAVDEHRCCHFFLNMSVSSEIFFSSSTIDAYLITVSLSDSHHHVVWMFLFCSVWARGHGMWWNWERTVLSGSVGPVQDKKLVWSGFEIKY